MDRRDRPLPYRWVGWWPARAARRILIAAVYRPVMAIWTRGFTVSGYAHIPPGAAIFAATHTSMADTPLILRALGRRADHVVVTAARDYFFRRARPGFGPLVAFAFGAVPIDRTGPARQSLNDAMTWLRCGYSLIIYPEGEIPDTSQTEKRLHRGVVLLAKLSQRPIIPVRMEGAAALLPAGAHWPRRACVRVTFLPALSYADAENSAALTEALRAFLFPT